MARTTVLRDKIVDAALALAETSSWEAVRLHDVAAALGLSLNDIRAHFREKEELVDAWFDCADRAMLDDAVTPQFQALPSRQRLHQAIMVWLTTLAAHKKVTREMICGRMEPGHLHVQFPGLLRISRTVQWFREAAQRDATFLRRALEETGTTAIYLVTFFYWMRDDSANNRRTGELLERLLTGAQMMSKRVWGQWPRPTEAGRRSDSTGHSSSS